MRAFLAALALVSLAAADSTAPRQVRLDVVATDARGQIVQNLTAADFDVREDGVLQKIEDVRFVQMGRPAAGDAPIPIASTADERAEAARPNTRLVAVFLDEYHVNPESAARVRAALTRFLDEYLTPRDLAVVMRPLDSLFEIRLTRDRERLRAAIDGFSGRQGDYTPRNTYERNFIGGSPARIEQLRAQVSTSAINALAVHIGNLDGDARKTLIIVSEGLPRADRRRGLEGLPTVETLARSADRYNVSVFVVDPHEAAADAVLPAEPTVLTTLAAATNGQAIVNVADLGEAMRPIGAEVSAYYLLRYQAATPPDGRFHDVQISAKKPGVIVRTRKRYWSPLPDDELRALALAPPPPPKPAEPARHLSPFIKPWFGAARGADGRTRMTFVWEPAARIPGSKQPVAAYVALKVLAADGTALFDGMVLPTGPLGPDAVDEPRVRAEFEAPPGSLRLRMAISDQAEQAIDSDVRDLVVRDLSAPVVIGTPAIFRGRTARDFRAFASSTNAAPVSAREFSRTERLLIRVPIYSPPGAAASVTARLQNRKGQTLRTLTEQRPAPSSPLREFDLPLSSFAAGDYRLQFAVKTAAAEVTDVLDLRVTN